MIFCKIDCGFFFSMCWTASSVEGLVAWRRSSRMCWRWVKQIIKRGIFLFLKKFSPGWANGCESHFKDCLPQSKSLVVGEWGFDMWWCTIILCYVFLWRLKLNIILYPLFNLLSVFDMSLGNVCQPGVESSKLNRAELAIISEPYVKSHKSQLLKSYTIWSKNKILSFLLWYPNLAKHLVKDGKQHIF